jgi:hypothetical protein
MTGSVRFDRDAYAKTYYKDYYQKHKEKINEARKKRLTINKIEKLYGVKLDDELYDIYNENRELYNKVFKQLKQNKERLTVVSNVNPILLEHFKNHIIV